MNKRQVNSLKFKRFLSALKYECLVSSVHLDHITFILKQKDEVQVPRVV